MIKIGKQKKVRGIPDPGQIRTEVIKRPYTAGDTEYTESPEETVLLYPPSLIPQCVQISAASLIGTRRCQQDNLWCEGREDELLAVICDGMGGMEGGGLASACAIAEIVDCFRQEDAPIRNVPSFFFQSMQMMNRAVCRIKDEKGKTLECGTTCVAAYVYKNRLFWFSIGDSKLYLVRDGQIYCPFKPHNYGTQLEAYRREGTISEEEYQKEKEKEEALTSFLGIGRIRLFEISQEPFGLKKGDRIVLCSDGLYRALTEEQILNILDVCCDDFSKAADIFIEALRSFAPKPMDNVSIICIAYVGNNAEP